MRIQTAGAMAVLVAASGFTLGQMAATPPPATAPTGPAGEVQAAYEHIKPNILKAADKMPADAFTYKPEPDVRTFARVLNHVTEVQVRVCGAIDKVAPESIAKVPPETADKATIVAALQASFTECDKAYATITDANLTDMFAAGPIKRSRIGMLWSNVSHDNEQYATLALYLRLKGLVPPSSEK